MAAERPSAQEPVRELRLEGVALVIVGGILLALVAGAFQLGRWFERRSLPEVSAGPGAADPLGAVVPPERFVDADEGLDHFDEIEADAGRAEPSRQARPPEPEARSAGDDPETGSAVQASRPAAEPPPVGQDGPYWVQISSGRDRVAAERAVSELQQRGFSSRVVPVQERGETLYKVRVGGWDSEERARSAVRELDAGGWPNGWVVHEP